MVNANCNPSLGWAATVVAVVVAVVAVDVVVAVVVAVDAVVDVVVDVDVEAVVEIVDDVDAHPKRVSATATDAAAVWFMSLTIDDKRDQSVITG